MTTRLFARRAGLEPALRLARRLALQSVGRSLLIAGLIALPIVGVAGIDTIEASHTATAADTARLELGRTQAAIHIMSPPDKGLMQDPVDPLSSGSSSNTADRSLASNYRTPSEVLPDGTELIPTKSTTLIMQSATGVGSLLATEGAVWSPSLRGAYEVLSGRAPRSSDEVMVSPHALVRLGARVGGTVVQVQPFRRTYRVVGTIRGASDTDGTDEVYGRLGAFDAPGGRTTNLDRLDDLQSTTYYVPDQVVTWPMVRQLNHAGMTVLSRHVLFDPPRNAPLTGSSGTSGSALTVLFAVLIGVFAMFEVCLLAGAAFAVGTRHRQRVFAILSSVGATRRLLFGVMAIEGALLGLVGGIVGACGGVAVAAFAEPLLAAGSQTQFPAFRVDLPVLALIVLGAMMSGLAAAAVPARSASRVDTVVALRGARRPPKPSAHRPMIGVFVTASGSVIALLGGLVTIGVNQSPEPSQALTAVGVTLLAAGPVVMQIGMVMIAPLLLRAVAQIATRWGTGARLASRDAARNPGRTVPALAAIMSCVFVAAFAMCVISGGQTLSTRNHSWQGPLDTGQVSLYTFHNDGSTTLVSGEGIAQALDHDLPGAATRILRSTPDVGALGHSLSSYTVARLPHSLPESDSYLNGGGPDHITVGTADDLAAILGEAPSAESRATLASGGAVALYSEYVRDGRATFDTVAPGSSQGQAGRRLATTSIPATVQKPAHPEQFGLFVSPSTAERLHMHVVDSLVFTTLRQAPTQAQQDAVASDLAVVGGGDASATFETGPTPYAAKWAWALLALTTAIALGASSVALALSRADGRRDRDTLAVIGAPPRVQRAFGFWQGIVIVGVGCVVGVLLGLVPAFALSIHGDAVTHGYLPFTPPWLQLLLTAVAIPALVAGTFWLVSRQSRRALTTRRDPVA